MPDINDSDLHELLNEGMADLRSGRVRPAEEVFTEIEELLYSIDSRTRSNTSSNKSCGNAST